MDILLLVLRLVLAGLLYGFLGAVLLMLWRDLRESPRRRHHVRPRGQLIVVEATGEETDAPPVGTIFPLETITTIGRSPHNSVTLSDTFASSQHALLSWREGQWWLEDRDSRNGTLLNGEPVEDPTIVGTGDVIAIGRTKLRIETD